MIRTLALLFATAAVLLSLLVQSWNRGESELPISGSARDASARPAATDADPRRLRVARRARRRRG